MALLALALCFLLVPATLYHPRGTSLFAYIASRGQFWVPLTIIGCVAGVLFVAMALAVLYQVIFEAQIAVWTEGERLIYLNRLLVSAPMPEIESVTVDSNLRSFGHRYRGVVLQLRDGRIKTIPTWILSEPAEVLLPRIREKISSL